MRNMIKVCSAVLFMVFGLALPQAYSGEMEKEKMMEKEKGMMK